MATYFRLLDVGRQFFDNSGDPLNGGKLYTYEAGTTTAKTTYQDDAGATPHANPIVLDSAGRPSAEVWGTTGGYKLKLDNSLDSTIWTRDDVVGFNDTAETSASEWIASGLTPTYVSAASFTFAGDQTTVYHVGRRLKTTDTGGTDYATITASDYNVTSPLLTTLVVNVDGSGSLDSGLSAVQYGVISAVNSSVRGGWSLITRGSVSAAATFDVTGFTTDYIAYMITFDNLKPATDNVELWLRLSNSSGTIQSAASDYAWGQSSDSEAGAATNTGDDADSEISIGPGWGDQATEVGSGHIVIYNPMATSVTQCSFSVARQSQAPVFVYQAGGGALQTAQASSACRLLFASGNIATMDYAVYGLKK